MSFDTLIILKNKLIMIRFHIRVHFAENNCLGILTERELIHLQYLAMFLKKANSYFLFDSQDVNIGQEPEEWNQFLKKVLTVFIVPLTHPEYPFSNRKGIIDYSTYVYVSQHLRLLSKRYTGVIYGVDEEANYPVVTSLDFRKNRKYMACFP